MPTLQVSLPPQLDQFVKDSVASGAYRNVDEVVREALFRLGSEVEVSENAMMEQFGYALQKGIDELDRGQVSDQSWDEIIAEAEREELEK